MREAVLGIIYGDERAGEAHKELAMSEIVHTSAARTTPQRALVPAC